MTSRDSKRICVVTLHGIGFEQAPQTDKDGVVLKAGYADSLHMHLSKCLGSMLSDDPNRRRAKDEPGVNGAIYVQSCWAENGGTPSHEVGMKRLGVWSDDMTCIIRDDVSHLISDEDYASGKRVSHVALVYSNLEKPVNETGATLITLERSFFAVDRYGTPLNVLKMVKDDILAVFRERSQEPAQSQSTGSLQPRNDMDSKHKAKAVSADTAPASGLLDTLEYLKDDVACYVCNNDERERVRSVVREALMRLAYRDDVDEIVLNTHSNGTVIAFDVLRHLPQEAAKKIKVLVTAGSPLRKYVDLFNWGTEVQCLYPFQPWYNFWDPFDPVADRLDQPASWHLGDDVVSSDKKLFSRIELNYEQASYLKVYDIQVSNIENSDGGGLQAHNYWDNVPQFVQALARIVCDPVFEEVQKAA